MLLELQPSAEAGVDALDLAVSLDGRPILLAAGQRLWPDGGLSRQVLFVERGLITQHWGDPEGEAAEVDAIGPGGAVGLLEALAQRPAVFESRAALPTEGRLVSADVLRRRTQQDPAVAAAVWALALGQQTRARRAAACAARHGARARLADYLLMLHDASAGRRLEVTQEALGAALGVYRTTVTALLAELVGDGILEAGRGRLAVLEPHRLALAGCGCRATAKAQK